MASNLQELRRAAGYKSASAFAEEHGISVPTYARYESKPEKIPLASAWQLADALGCSIDEVVGREKPDTSDRRGEFQRFYDGLSPENRSLMDEFRAFVAQRERAAQARRRADQRQRYRALARQYELLMLGEREAQASFGDLVAFGSPEEHRAALEDFIAGRAAKRREQELKEYEGSPEFAEKVYAGGPIAIGAPDGETEDFVFPDDPRYEEMLEDWGRSELEKKAKELERRDAKVIERIMAAYDETREMAEQRTRLAWGEGAETAEFDSSLADSLFIPFPDGGGAQDK